MSEKRQAEEATGIVENPRGLGKFYARGGKELTPTEAVDVLKNQGVIEVPNAGAGSYTALFLALGFEEVKPLDVGSSAGDWVFAVKDNGLWYIASQHNRYPYYGFSYCVDIHGFDTFKKIQNYHRSV